MRLAGERWFSRDFLTPFDCHGDYRRSALDSSMAPWRSPRCTGDSPARQITAHEMIQFDFTVSSGIFTLYGLHVCDGKNFTAMQRHTKFSFADNTKNDWYTENQSRNLKNGTISRKVIVPKYGCRNNLSKYNFPKYWTHVYRVSQGSYAKTRVPVECVYWAESLLPLACDEWRVTRRLLLIVDIL